MGIPQQLLPGYRPGPGIHQARLGGARASQDSQLVFPAEAADNAARCAGGPTAGGVWGLYISRQNRTAPQTSRPYYLAEPVTQSYNEETGGSIFGRW
jgi:hypothetical protein